MSHPSIPCFVSSGVHSRRARHPHSQASHSQATNSQPGNQSDARHPTARQPITPGQEDLDICAWQPLPVDCAAPREVLQQLQRRQGSGRQWARAGQSGGRSAASSD